MSETMNEQDDFQDFEVQRAKTDGKDFKLPKIDRISSRGGPKEIKSSTKLPTIRSEPLIQGPQYETQRKPTVQQDLVGQVERRLKLIMEEQNILQINESSQGEEDDFEQKINRNKELIKEAKRRNQLIKKQNEQMNNFNNFNKGLIQQSNQRKASHKTQKIQGYEKRMKDYRENSIENKHLGKKKELNNVVKNVAFKQTKDQKQIPKSSTLLKESNAPNRELKEVRSREELSNANKYVHGFQNKQSIQSENRKMKKQYSHKFLTPIQKNEQLFDAIHNYLDNPKRAQRQISSHKIIRDKQELQEKLKEYEQKLSQNQNDVLTRHKESTKSEVHRDNKKMVSSSQWRKLGINESNCLMEEGSSFQQELDKIGRYLQRNQKSLEKYVQNQKLLVDVQMALRQNSRQRAVSNQKQCSI